MRSMRPWLGLIPRPRRLGNTIRGGPGDSAFEHREAAFEALAQVIDHRQPVLTRVGGDGELVDVPGGSNIAVVEVPEDLRPGVAVSRFEDRLSLLAVEGPGDEH